jgi:DNA-binding PadR family transcriptional regulator
MSDLSLPSIESGENPVDILLDQVLTPTDVRIIDVVARFTNERGKTPTASDILEEFAKSSQLKKTQLYERLNRLSRLGFLSVKQLPRPRRYIANQNTITKGVEKWVEEQRASITSLSTELEVLLDFLKGMNTDAFASALTEKLSTGFEST